MPLIPAPTQSLMPIVAVLSAFIAGTPAMAQRVENQVAVFAALDKVTARISPLEVKLGETVTFGSLKVTPRVCYSRSATEQPKTTAFIDIDETLLNGQEKKLFSGWMFAESPGLNAVEHPVFDIWLTECRQPVKGADAQAAAAKPGAATDPSATTDSAPEPRRRPRH